MPERPTQSLYRHAIAICHASLPPDHARLKHIESKLEALESQLFTFPGMDQPPPMAVVAPGGKPKAREA